MAFSDMNAHKKMAGADAKGNFGVSGFPGRTASHPDVGMKHTPMDDSARMAPMKGNGGMMQAAPDHGPMGTDHFKRDGKM